jgi:hypothetical protein
VRRAERNVRNVTLGPIGPATQEALVSAPLVTISAAWGTGGSRIGPRVAERIGLAFGDRAPLDLAASAATRDGSHAG